MQQSEMMRRLASRQCGNGEWDELLIDDACMEGGGVVRRWANGLVVMSSSARLGTRDNGKRLRIRLIY